MDTSETIQARPRKGAELFKALVLFAFSVKFLTSSAPGLGTLVGLFSLALAICAGILVVVAILRCLLT